MSRSLFPALIVGAAVGAAAVPVLAVTCFEVIDRTNAIIYRSSQSPVDLSDAGARSREAMRDRGELLVFFDAETCMALGRSTLNGGSTTLTADQIVAEFKSYAGPSSWGTWSSRMGGSP